MGRRARESKATELISKSCTLALALAPMAIPLVLPARRVRASVLFSFDNASVFTHDPQFPDYTGPAYAVPGSLYAFVASALPNGGVKVTGAVGPVLGDANAYSALDFAIQVHMGGTVSGDILAAERLVANAAFEVSASAGDLSFIGWTIDSDLGLSGEDLVVEPVTDGTVLRTVLSDPAGVDMIGVNGTWGLDMAIRWTPTSASDQLSITIPSNSIDVYVAIPEPTMAAVLVLPALIALGRRRGRTLPRGENFNCPAFSSEDVSTRPAI